MPTIALRLSACSLACALAWLNATWVGMPAGPAM